MQTRTVLVALLLVLLVLAGQGAAGGQAGPEVVARALDRFVEAPTREAAQRLDELKRRYHVDDNRVYLTGISDGGTGAYFMAFRDTTPWASFLPLNGHMMVLANPDTGADGELHPGNAVNKPFFIVNGGQDRLYPTRSVEPYVGHLRKIGTTVVYHPQPNAGHNTEWWPAERAS